MGECEFKNIGIFEIYPPEDLDNPYSTIDQTLHNILVGNLNLLHYISQSVNEHHVTPRIFQSQS